MTVMSGLFREVSNKNLPKDVPIVKGKIVSTRTFRSDELKRGIEIVIETNLSLKGVAEYYNNEFSQRDFKVLNIPNFQGNSRNLEDSTEADTIVEDKGNQQIVIIVRTEQQFTLVRIQVLGNSIFTLPS